MRGALRGAYGELAPSTVESVGSICMRPPFDPSPAHGRSCEGFRPASSCMEFAVKHPTCIHRPSIWSQLRVAKILDSSVRATAWLHCPTASPTTLMSGYFENTSLAALVRAVSTDVPGTPVTNTMLPLPLSFLASHSAVTRPASSWLMVTL